MSYQYLTGDDLDPTASVVVTIDVDTWSQTERILELCESAAGRKSSYTSMGIGHCTEVLHGAIMEETHMCDVSVSFQSRPGAYANHLAHRIRRLLPEATINVYPGMKP